MTGPLEVVVVDVVDELVEVVPSMFTVVVDTAVTPALLRGAVVVKLVVELVVVVLVVLLVVVVDVVLLLVVVTMVIDPDWADAVPNGVTMVSTTRTRPAPTRMRLVPVSPGMSIHVAPPSDEACH